MKKNVKRKSNNLYLHCCKGISLIELFVALIISGLSISAVWGLLTYQNKKHKEFNIELSAFQIINDIRGVFILKNSCDHTLKTLNPPNLRTDQLEGQFTSISQIKDKNGTLIYEKGNSYTGFHLEGKVKLQDVGIQLKNKIGENSNLEFYSVLVKVELKDAHSTKTFLEKFYTMVTVEATTDDEVKKIQHCYGIDRYAYIKQSLQDNPNPIEKCLDGESLKGFKTDGEAKCLGLQVDTTTTFNCPCSPSPDPQCPPPNPPCLSKESQCIRWETVSFRLNSGFKGGGSKRRKCAERKWVCIESCPRDHLSEITKPCGRKYSYPSREAPDTLTCQQYEYVRDGDNNLTCRINPPTSKPCQKI